MSVTEFLCARLDEDEASAKHVIAVAGGDDFGPAPAMTPARLLREVQAKRAILEVAVRLSQHTDLGSATDEDGDAILTYLAAAYSDHPDFDGALYG